MSPIVLKRSQSLMPAVALAGCALLVLTFALNEYGGVPTLLGELRTEVRHAEFLTEAFGALVIAGAVVAYSRKLTARAQQLEELLTLCAWCRRVSCQGRWLTIAEFLDRQNDLHVSSSVCPDCATKA